MPTYYVDSAAVGANNGSSWADAWTSIDSALTTVAADDTVLVDDGHSEDLGANKSYTISGASPVKVQSVDKADDSLSPGAQVRNNGGSRDIYFYGTWHMHGMRWEAGHQIGFYPGLGEQSTTEHCYLKVGVVAAAAIFYPNFSVLDSKVVLIETDVELAGAASTIALYPRFEWLGGNLITSSAAGHIFVPGTNGTGARICGVDLSAESGALFDPGTTGYKSDLLIERCKLHSSVSVVSGVVLGPSSRFKVHHCQAGTDGDPTYAMEEHTYSGSVKTKVLSYRAGGASDGERATPYSWAISSNANVKEIYQPIESPPITAFTNGDGSTTYTYTLYFCMLVQPMKNDELWVVLSLPNDADTSSKAGRKSSRCDPQATPEFLTYDGDSTWVGIVDPWARKVEIDYTPRKPGLVVARCFLAKSQKIVHVDPKIYISRNGKPDMAAKARAIFVPGHGAVQEGEARMLVGSGMGGGLK